MTNSTHSQVIVLGFGPVGEATALLLGVAGLSVQVIEQETDVFHLPRAAACGHEVMRVLQRLGLAEQVLAISGPNSATRFLDAAGEVFAVHEDGRGTSSGWPANTYLWYQPEYDRILRDAASSYANVDVSLGHRVTEIEESPTGVSVTVIGPDGAEEVRTGEYLIGADGARSMTRQYLGAKLTDYGCDEEWLVVDGFLSSDPGEPPDVTLFCDPARPMMMMRGAGTHRRWEFRRLPGETAEGLAEPSHVSRLLSRFIDPSEFEIKRATVYRFHALIADRYGRGRVWIVGDAAHQAPPFMGQGMSSGVRDAANLVWKLAMVIDGEASPRLLESYEHECRHHFEGVLERTLWVGGLYSELDPALSAQRRSAILEAQANGEHPLARLALPPFAAGALDPSRSPQTGALFPQTTVEWDGASRWFDDVVGAGFVLVAPVALATEIVNAGARAARDMRLAAVLPPDGSGADLLQSGWDPLVDETGKLGEWLGTYGAAVVRPDRYVFGTARTGDAMVALLEALNQELNPPAPVPA
jgi:3-(3-hydroxy-phenyl)propionate hydroxylase